MKFDYQYRTSGNELRTGIIRAANRDAAFAALKAQGIRPSRVEDSPGLLNKVFGKGKRWIAIGALSLVVAALLALTFRMRRETKTLVLEEEDRNTYQSRTQVYGDPVILKDAFADNWASVFPDEGDRFLAAYAIPGRDVVWSGELPIAALESTLATNVVVATDDFSEIAMMKRIVNGMKREARAYIAAGGTVASYAKRLAKRQREEMQYLARIRTELSMTDDAETWRDRNAALRAMGLPMIEKEDDSQD